MSERSPRLLLGAHFPGKEQVAWRHPGTRDLINVDSFLDNARAADEALFHFMFLAETLSLSESDGKILAHKLNGRPDTIGIQATLAGVTRHVGFVNTLNTTYNEPYDLARQLATLDILSQGRAAWNLVTAQPPATVANFSKGDYLPYEHRYERGEEFLAALTQFWPGHGRDAVSFEGEHISVRGRARWPVPPQSKRPIILQASNSPTGSRFGAQHADGIYIIPRDIDDARNLYARVKSQLPEFGRTREDLKVIAGLRFVVGDSPREAQEKFDHYLDLEFSDQDIITELERIWLIDLSGTDPDGQLPSVDPDFGKLGAVLAKSPAKERDPRKLVENWRSIAAAEKLTNRQLVKRLTVRPGIVGSPQTIADQIEHWLDSEAADGFIVQPQVVPLGVLEFAERVVPVLQERGLFRTHAPQQTLREAWLSSPGRNN